MQKRKILFLGETYRADAITWQKGLQEFGGFEIQSWELQTPSNSFKNRWLRGFEFVTAIFKIRKIVRSVQPDLVVAERTTSYGFLAALSGANCIVIAQQGITDLWPIGSLSYPIKKIMQQYTFQKAHLIHAWGSVMTPAMLAAGANMQKVLVLPKGIDLKRFKPNTALATQKIHAIVTRSLTPEYGHEVILKAFAILDQKGVDFELTILGDGSCMSDLKKQTSRLQLQQKVRFLGSVLYTELPQHLQKANYYLSMPNTEGVSASLFEAMATHCYPIVSDIAGNQQWITHNQNGSLVAVGDYQTLAETILNTYKQPEYRSKALDFNLNLVQQQANYQINMALIAQKYHELLWSHQDQQPCAE
ncbi:glycosyltransferase [Flavobacterium crassostreae]|uniref:Glycosyl transferase family 1 n=1 Tax=Flavobacterium crassostreae TaxID=1763534 RepID=A0A1B9E3H5_9FLAO|nr:glycosyltransferase [Flavobacterium crassostreae]OCB76490.1 glycosyl transferase family 1 [Flavobacterium crassostreae]